MYCNKCHKNVRSIAHWSRVHPDMLHRKKGVRRVKSRMTARGKHSKSTRRGLTGLRGQIYRKIEELEKLAMEL